METLSSFLINRIKGLGIDTAFGVPGDYIIDFYKNLYDSSIKVINSTSEQCAGFSADAYARLNGSGLLVVTYGVGGFNTVNAIACAYSEKSPVIVISGSPSTEEKNQDFYPHHFAGSYESQFNIYKNITCGSVVLNDIDSDCYNIDKVLNLMKKYKQPVYIEIPRDRVNKGVKYDVYTKGTPKQDCSHQETEDEAINEIIRHISTSERPIIWAGVEVARFDLGCELLDWAKKNDIPIMSSILGKGVVNESDEMFIGIYCDKLSSRELKTYVKESDCLIMLGVMQTDLNFGFSSLNFCGKSTININTNLTTVKNHTYSKIVFKSILEKLFKTKPDCVKRKPRFKKEIKTQNLEYFNIDSIVNYINKIENENFIIISDIGDSLFGTIDININTKNSFLCNSFYASMGFAVPAAVGAYSYCKSRRPIVFVGDGAFQMTGQDFSTLVKIKSNAIVIVIDNNGYLTERLILDGEFNNITSWDYSSIAKSYGGVGISVNNINSFIESFVNCLSIQDRPSLIHAKVDEKNCSSNLKKLFKKSAL